MDLRLRRVGVLTRRTRSFTVPTFTECKDQRRLKYQAPLVFLPFLFATAVGVPARSKCSAVVLGRVGEVVAVGHAVEVGGGAQALGDRCGLVAGVVLGGLLVGAGVMGGAV